MSDVNMNAYVHLERDAVWHVNNSKQVNPINFDEPVPPPAYITSGPHAGSLLFTATYSQNLAGGLISTGLPNPPVGCPGRKFQYFAMNVRQFIPAYAPGTVPRNELDHKDTFAGGLQANVSTEISPQYGWRLDPSGKAWVSTGYFPTTNKTGQSNVFQIRSWSDGVGLWSVLGLQCNNEFPFTPGAPFQNVPLIQTGSATSGPWTPGIRPQLQWEGGLTGTAPQTVEVYYERVDVITSDFPIPMLDPATF